MGNLCNCNRNDGSQNSDFAGVAAKNRKLHQQSSMKSNASSIVSHTFFQIRIIYQFFIRTTRLGSWLTKENCRKRTITRNFNYTLSTASPSRRTWNNSQPKPALTSAHNYFARAIVCHQQNRQNRLPSRTSKCTLSSNQERKQKLRR